MGSITATDVPQCIPGTLNKLKYSLRRSKVYIPGDEGYAQSIVRWSDAFEKEAVCDIPKRSFSVNLDNMNRVLW